MTARELQSLLSSPAPPRLIHVLPPEIFAAQRIPGSVNACVYETAFLDHLATQGIGTGDALVVYGAGGTSHDVHAAVEKLHAAGFERVSAFPGGLEEWRAAGLPLEGSGELPKPPVPDGSYRLDCAQSIIRWTGRNLFNHHHGFLRCSGGEIELHAGELVTARFTVDMNSIACEDLTDGAINAMLIAHLKSSDFFETVRFPVAEFRAERAERIHGCTDGTPNFIVHGMFTLRGISRPLSFPVLVAPSEDGGRITAQGQFEIDRTAFGSEYGSGKLFRFLGRHLVNDHVHLHVKVHADRVS